MRRNAPMRRGDVYALNDPYHGGTHLPDVTVVTPVFSGLGTAQLFRGPRAVHHADIGGVTPGSNAAVLDRHRRRGCPSSITSNWWRAENSAREALLELLRGSSHPARNPGQKHRRPCVPKIAAN